jgi:hypothetical protein
LTEGEKGGLLKKNGEQEGEPMQPTLWQPPIEPSPTEQTIIKRIRRAKLFVFLREQRHDIFNPAFQEELSGLYRDSKRGQPPIPPAQLALATLLQAYTGASSEPPDRDEHGSAAD